MKVYTLATDPLLQECDVIVAESGKYVAASLFDSYQHLNEIISYVLGLGNRRRYSECFTANALMDYGLSSELAVECVNKMVTCIENLIQSMISDKVHYSTHHIEVRPQMIVIRELGYATVHDTQSYPKLASILSEVLFDDDSVWQRMSVDDLVDQCRMQLPTIKYNKRRSA